MTLKFSHHRLQQLSIPGNVREGCPFSHQPTLIREETLESGDLFSGSKGRGDGDGLEVESMSRNPEGRGSIPRLGSRRSSLISIEHAELLRSTPSLVLCCAWLVTMALHVHGGLGQLSPLPTSGDDKWVAAKHCGRAKRSRISDTHRLRSSLQFRYINNQSF